MTFHYHINCDGCGFTLKHWDEVPEDWATIRIGCMERERHYCAECVTKLGLNKRAGIGGGDER